MFKVSQEIHLGVVADQGSVYGKYQKSPEEGGTFNFQDKKIFVSPEVTDIAKVKVLHFPEKTINHNEVVEFVVKKNGARGNVEVKQIDPSGLSTDIPTEISDPDRFNIKFLAKYIGMYKIFIKFNGIELPSSPFFIYVEESKNENQKSAILTFNSDGRQIKYRGVGLKHISVKDKNEFTIDASDAGNNILFVGICGPKGQCDEVIIKHLGNNVYNVTYRVTDAGNYVIAVKWGDEHIPDSPFNIEAHQ